MITDSGAATITAAVKADFLTLPDGSRCINLAVEGDFTASQLLLLTVSLSQSLIHIGKTKGDAKAVDLGKKIVTALQPVLQSCTDIHVGPALRAN